VVVPTLFEVVTDTPFPRGPFGADELYADVERGRIQEREYWAELGRRRPDLDIAQYMRDRLYVRSEVRQFLAELGGRVRIAGLTNDMTHWFGPGWAEKFPEFGSFDRLLEAARSGVLKPDPAVFRWALGQLGEPAGACLFVDDLESNVRGARAAGMETEVFDVTDPAGSVTRVLARLGLGDGQPPPRVYRPAAQRPAAQRPATGGRP
jgi:HAD superfamily hydrolase (TIGR01509 family)